MSIRYFEASTPASAWEWAKKVIKATGQKVVTEDGQVTKEIVIPTFAKIPGDAIYTTIAPPPKTLFSIRNRFVLKRAVK